MPRGMPSSLPPTPRGRYTDNIVRVFAHAAAMMLTMGLEIGLFGATPTCAPAPSAVKCAQHTRVLSRRPACLSVCVCFSLSLSLCVCVCVCRLLTGHSCSFRPRSSVARSTCITEQRRQQHPPTARSRRRPSSRGMQRPPRPPRTPPAAPLLASGWAALGRRSPWSSCRLSSQCSRAGPMGIASGTERCEVSVRQVN